MSQSPLTIDQLLAFSKQGQEIDKTASEESPNEEGMEKLAAELEAAGTIFGRAAGEEFVKIAAYAGGGGDVGSKWRQFADAELARQGRDTSVGETPARVAKPGGVLKGAGGVVNPRQAN